MIIQCSCRHVKTTADTADVQQNTSILNAQVVSRDPWVFVNNCVSKGREDVSMGWGIGYMEVHTVAKTYESVVKQGYSSCPCRVSLMWYQDFVACMGTGHSIAAARY